MSPFTDEQYAAWHGAVDKRGGFTVHHRQRRCSVFGFEATVDDDHDPYQGHTAGYSQVPYNDEPAPDYGENQVPADWSDN
jgi:hypothetical protein